LGSFDTRLYLDMNRFAERTAWLHGVVRTYAGAVGIVVLGLVLLAAWWRARDDVFGGGGAKRVADVCWAAIAALLAAVVALPVAHVVGRARPYVGVHQAVEVLAARSGGFGMPSARAALAGALVAGILLARQWAVGVLAALAGLLLAAAQVYVGVSYPGDVAVGLVGGLVLVVVVRPLAIRPLRSLTGWAAGVKGVRFLVGASVPVQFGAGVGRPPAGAGSGLRVEGSLQRTTPAGAVAAGAAEGGGSGSVRILESGKVLVPHVPDGEARRVARNVTPAQAHVQPAPGPPEPAAAAATTTASTVRDAHGSGRRGAAGSAGDL
jgi:membrane-associated phospholipid phosphatase